MDEKKTSYPGISAEGYRQNTELSRCIFQIFLKYIKLFQKYSLYWFYAVLIFTSKLRGPLQQNYPSPQQYNPPPHQNKNFWPPSKDFSEIFNPPQAGGGVHVMLDTTFYISRFRRINSTTLIFACHFFFRLPFLTAGLYLKYYQLGSSLRWPNFKRERLYQQNCLSQ